MKHRIAAVSTGVAYIGTILGANWLVTHYPSVPVGLGWQAPAGVFTVGIALVLRDLLHEWGGWKAVFTAIAIGTGLSYWLADPRFAFASAVAFAVAELADMLVYSPLRRRGLLLAVAASNAVGLVVDSWLFLKLAFDDLTFLPGQILAKTYMTVAAALVLWLIVRHRTRKNPPVVGDPCGCTVLQRGLCGHCAHDRCEDCKQCAGAGHPVHECQALA
ncbi:VUT family protein [Streptomyces violaceus]|uniref:VUT family protein n=1 Tax=Streptomyces violaceus TaxID=1936 RepID=A0ABY9UMV4_STRVL|nr:VUT family protein [Streptomyces janthinus]WND24175.1 VUT family protein [Streptomyces janthinus]GGS96634.1 hypothetical protein GCM10010270_80750 [Streptomyces janthinus]